MDNIFELPIVALRGLVVFPGMKLQFDVARKKSLNAIKAAMNGNQKLFLVAQKDIRDDDPTMEDLYRVGVVVNVKQMFKLSIADVERVSVEGLYRADLAMLTRSKPYLRGEIIRIDEPPILPQEQDYAAALVRRVKGIFEGYATVATKLTNDVVMAVLAENDPTVLADFIAGNIMLEYTERQKILSEINVLKRLERLCVVLEQETELLEIEEDITERVQEQIDRNQREYYLREQMKAISVELNDGEDVEAETVALKEQILAAKLDEKSEEKLLKECNRLSKMQSSSPEATVIRNYLETCLSIPWNKESKDKLNINTARKVLEKDHYGMKDVKDRIIEHLAVRQIAPDIKGQIICLAGPPGVGKTSVAKSVAKAMGREYARISLGGIRDEAEIRGHRKTYIGSMPGRIISAIQKAGTMNPLILLDEVDKLGNDFKGDPASALLEVLDAEQNNTFCDHYIEIPVDLSKVLFITTANDKSTIPAPLLDRMEIIDMSSYTAEEKFHIAKKHLVPKQIKQHGLTSKQLKISDDAIRFIIYGYTRESGVRKLERAIAGICRKSALEIVSGNEEKVSVTPVKVKEMLGAIKYKQEVLSGKSEIGVVNGLAWTSVGGEMLKVEVAVVNGTGKLETTGSLGDVMKESAKAAMTYVRKKADQFGIEETFYKDKDIHIHVPEGAVPKDGPSAGVTIATALVSALTDTPVRQDVAMTGEITLRGRVLPIGGLREKSMAAYRYGIKTVVIPLENEADLEKVDEAVLKSIDFVVADNIDTVLETALLYEKKNTADKKEEPRAEIISDKINSKAVKVNYEI